MPTLPFTLKLHRFGLLGILGFSFFFFFEKKKRKSRGGFGHPIPAVWGWPGLWGWSDHPERPPRKKKKKKKKRNGFELLGVAGPSLRAWGWLRPPPMTTPRPLGVVRPPPTAQTHFVFFFFFFLVAFRGGRTTPKGLGWLRPPPYGRYGWPKPPHPAIPPPPPLFF
jgi:hypothetical protein